MSQPSDAMADSALKTKCAMPDATAKLITLERAEAFSACDRPESSQAAFAKQAEALRREIPSHIVAAYDQLKANHKEAVVAVFEENCGGCRAPLSKTAMARLSVGTEANRCENCGRFIYLAGGHNLARSGPLHHLTGSHSEK